MADHQALAPAAVGDVLFFLQSIPSLIEQARQGLLVSNGNLLEHCHIRLQNATNLMVMVWSCIQDDGQHEFDNTFSIKEGCAQGHPRKEIFKQCIKSTFEVLKSWVNIARFAVKLDLGEEE